MAKLVPIPARFNMALPNHVVRAIIALASEALTGGSNRGRHQA